jgi:hypothetical protein
MKTGKLPNKNGLCYERQKTLSDLKGPLDNDLLDMFKPTLEDLKVLNKQNLSRGYWASGLDQSDWIYNKSEKYTPLRQTIVLLMAAMNDEL